MANNHALNFFMKKKSVRRKKGKPAKTKPGGPKMMEINLTNVLPFIASTVADLTLKVDRLQKTVDAVGLAVACNQKMISDLEG